MKSIDAGLPKLGIITLLAYVGQHTGQFFNYQI